MTPLTKAASEGNVSAINRLLKNGANINETTNKGWQATPLIWALYSQKYEVAKLLIENGADINKPDNYGRTPLIYATDNEYLELIKLMIQKGADVNAKAADGYTAFLSSLATGNLAIIELFIDKGTDINSKTAEGLTPLIYTVIHGYNNTDSVKILLKNEADIFARDNYGNSVITHASASNNKDLIKIIKMFAVKKYRDNDFGSRLNQPAQWGMGSKMNFEIPANKTRIEYVIEFEECKYATKYLEGHNSPGFYLAGPVSLGFEYLNSRKFQQCMAAFNYKCVNNCLVK